MTAQVDFAALIESVARHLLGEPNARMSSRSQLRFGTLGSVAVEIAGDRKGQWYDHENEKGGGTLDLVAHKTGRANGEAVAWLKENGFIDAAPKIKSVIVATYDYRDRNGALKFQVVRFRPKDFRQRRPDGRGGWLWNLNGVERVPYRLPEMLKAASHAVVFICEGEKDVDSLAEYGLIATTNPGGAGKWQSGISAHLSGRHAVILPDADEAGEQHAQDVAAKLHGIARSVRILRLPGLPPKGDVSDWLKAGGTADELERLAAAVPETGDQQQPADSELADPLGIWDAGEDDYQIPPRGWLLGTTFCRRFLSSLVADGGVGKTVLRLAQLISLATGHSLTGEHVFARCRVLGRVVKSRAAFSPFAPAW